MDDMSVYILVVKKLAWWGGRKICELNFRNTYWGPQHTRRNDLIPESIIMSLCNVKNRYLRDDKVSEICVGLLIV